MISMNSERLLVVVALCCVLAAGASASTLDSSLDTDPEDAVDLDWRYLPVGEGTAEAVVEESQSNDGDGTSPSRTGSGSTDATRRSEQGAPSDAQGGGGEGNSEAQKSSLENRGREKAGGRSDSPGGNQPGEVFTLLDLLRALIPWLVLLALLALAYRYRDRLFALAGALRDWAADRTADQGDRPRRWPRSVPANAVHRAWLRMVTRLDVDRPEARTPAECERAALAEGYDPDAVRGLSARFREVRYGGRPVTGERVEDVQEHLRRLEAGPERGDRG